MTISTHPFVPIDDVTAVPETWFSYVKTNLPKAVDGVGGGTYTPSSAIVINGSGLSSDNIGTSTVTGSLTIDGSATFNSDAEFNGALIVDAHVLQRGEIAPASLATAEHNWAPTGIATCSIIRAVPNAANTEISGIGALAAGRVITILNDGSGAVLSLLHANASSLVDNRFLLPGGAKIDIPQYGSATIWRDSTQSRWRVLSVAL